MKQYAESLSCRRKILLSYFGELIEKDCGNCDVCNNPPTIIDGTILSQKVLSCVTRIKEQEPIGTVIDILRGAQNALVVDQGYQHLKTYGIGHDIPWRDWQQYIIQLINQGYLEIAFHQNNKLKLTALSKKVLFKGEKVSLAHLKELEKVKQPVISTKQIASNDLFEKLRLLRLELAKNAGIPAYQIFNDATLREMEKHKPITDEEFMQINGVGRQKMQNYGYQFIKEIKTFVAPPKKKKKITKKGKTHTETLTLLKNGLSLEEIAIERKLTTSTIFSHIFKLYQDGEGIDLHQFIDKEDITAIQKAKETLNNPETLKPYYEHFDGAIDYNTIKIGLAILDKQNSII